MKYVIAALLLITSTFATLALAQDGGGRGPPDVIVSVPQPTTSTPTTGSTPQLSKLFKPAPLLASGTK